MSQIYEVLQIQKPEKFNLSYEQIADEASKIATAAEEAVQKAEKLWQEMLTANLRLSSEN